MGNFHSRSVHQGLTEKRVVVQKLVPVIGLLRNLHSRLCSEFWAVRVIDISDIPSMTGVTGSKNDKVGVHCISAGNDTRRLIVQSLVRSSTFESQNLYMKRGDA
jgi:hypothetical protein